MIHTKCPEYSETRTNQGSCIKFKRVTEELTEKLRNIW